MGFTFAGIAGMTSVTTGITVIGRSGHPHGIVPAAFLRYLTPPAGELARPRERMVEQ
jgi:hypothetical protein